MMIMWWWRRSDNDDDDDHGHDHDDDIRYSGPCFHWLFFFLVTLLHVSRLTSGNVFTHFIDTSNDLALLWRKAITWINDDLMPITLYPYKFSDYQKNISNNSFRKIAWN